jgi:hypothetical protein
LCRGIGSTEGRFGAEMGKELDVGDFLPFANTFTETV